MNQAIKRRRVRSHGNPGTHGSKTNEGLEITALALYFAGSGVLSHDLSVCPLMLLSAYSFCSFVSGRNTRALFCFWLWWPQSGFQARVYKLRNSVSHSTWQLMCELYTAGLPLLKCGFQQFNFIWESAPFYLITRQRLTAAMLCFSMAPWLTLHVHGARFRSMFFKCAFARLLFSPSTSV